MSFNQTIKAFIGIILGSVLLLNISACEEEKAPTKISYKDRQYADSLYKDTVLVIKVELDSICELGFEDMVTRFRDSIMKERVTEMEAQKAKIIKELQGK